jgi:hypothetical protein
MADQTIRIPADQIEAARRSLMHVYSGIAEALHRAAAEMAVGTDEVDATHGHRIELADAADALDQLGWTSGPGEGPAELSAHPELLSDVLVQMVHEALESLEIAIDTSARGVGEMALARTSLTNLLVRFKLYERVQGD